MLLMAASFVSAGATVMVDNVNPSTEENVTCYVGGSTAGFDMYWYKGSQRLLAEGNVNSLVLPSSMTEQGETYTCKVFRPSSSYVPEIFLGSVDVTIKEDFIWEFAPIKPQILTINWPECNDGLDNDNDGLVDLDDSGCVDKYDDNELNYHMFEFVIPSFVFPEDPEETYQCNDGLDNDNDDLVDMDDPGCDSPSDDDETNEDNPEETYQCNDGLDNDNDGLVDMDDPGCDSPSDDDETNSVPYTPTQCMDNMDNDNDGLVDMNDPGCDSPSDDDETNEDEEEETVNYSSPDLEIENVVLTVKDGTLEVMTSLYNNGGDWARNVDLRIYVDKLNIVEYVGVGSVKANSPVEMLNYIDVEGAEPGRYTVRVEAIGYKGVNDVMYRTFDIESNGNNIEFVFGVVEEPVKNLSWMQKIVKWFKELFTAIF